VIWKLIVVALLASALEAWATEIGSAALPYR
jgi:hypothetical protein